MLVLQQALDVENRRLSAQHVEKDKTIEQLSQHLAALIEQQQCANAQSSGSSMQCELEHVVAEFTNKEREVYASMVRARRSMPLCDD